MGLASVLVLFDGRCDFCTRTVAWTRRRDHRGRIQALPNQTPGLIKRFGLTREEVDRAVWTISEDGSRANGAAGVNVILRELGQPWSWLAWWLSLPGCFQLEERLYRWVADHRPLLSRWFGIRPECEEPGVECEPG